MVCEIVLFYPLTERETEDKRNGLAFTSLHPCYLLDTEGEMQSPQSILHKCISAKKSKMLPRVCGK